MVLIVADDMGYGDIAALGNPEVKTPVLDRLSNEGLVLSQHYAGSAVCAPSRAALMTGRYPHRTGAIDTLEGRGLDRLSLDEMTMGDAFGRLGYVTGLVGKWHLGSLDSRFHPNKRGYDYFSGFHGGWQDYWKWSLDTNGSIHKADGRYLTDVFTEEAVNFIHRNAQNPFFLNVSYNAPHFPLQVPDEDSKEFIDKGKFTKAVSLIYGMNKRMDEGIGRILESLDREGLTENTIIVFTSDNGPQFGGPGDMDSTRHNGFLAGCKSVVLEGGIRVPALLRWPAGFEGKRTINETIHFIDWFPTLLSLAGGGVKSNKAIDGQDMSAALLDDKGSINPQRVWESRQLFWQYNRYDPIPRCNAAMRDGPWKLVYPPIPEAMLVGRKDIAMDGRLKSEPEAFTDIRKDPMPDRKLSSPKDPALFNISEDPYEKNDLASTQPDRVSAMQRELDRWFEDIERERRG